MVASIWARVGASRREREELRRQQVQMMEQLQVLEARVADLVKVVARSQGMLFDRSPEAQRIKQAAKDQDKKPPAPPS